MGRIDIITEQNEMKAHQHQFVLWTRKWQEFHDAFSDPSAFTWEAYRLVDLERPRIPDQSGIYTLLIQPGIANHPRCSYLMYVGKTNSLRRRFGEYLNERKREKGRPKIYRLLNMYPDHIWFCFTLAPNESLITIENALMSAYIPPANDQLPADIRPVVRAF